MTTENTTRKHPLSDATYFTKRGYQEWDVVDYLSQAVLEDKSDFTKSSNLKAAFDVAIDSYLKDLRKIIDTLEDINTKLDADAKSEKKLEKARELLRAYRKGQDSSRAKGWRDKACASSIVVKNSSGIIIGNHSRIDTAAKPRKAKNPKKRKSDDRQPSSDVLPKVLVPPKTAPKPPPWNPIAFEEKYAQLDKDSMWTLPSGVIVEKVLYDSFRDAGRESLGHSFIIDVHNHAIEKLFDPPDWAEIIKKVPEWPKTDELLAESMMRFSELETPADLRRVLDTTSYLPEGESYDRDKHYDRYWVQLVWAMLLPLYEDPSQLSRENHESWYDINIWSAIVDRCLQDLKGMVVLRKETTCLANTVRKNRDRVDTIKRQKTGARFDGLVQDKSGQFEYAAMEASKHFSSETCSKWLRDYQKVAKALHDMLYRLEGHVKHDDAILRELQLVGLVSAGLHCQVLRINYAEGFVCVLSRDKCFNVPTMVKESPELLELLISIWRMKMVAKNCKALVDNRHNKNKNTTFKRLMEPPGLPSAHRPKIPIAYDTEREDGEDGEDDGEDGEEDDGEEYEEDE